MISAAKLCFAHQFYVELKWQNTQVQAQPRSCYARNSCPSWMIISRAWWSPQALTSYLKVSGWQRPFQQPTNGTLMSIASMTIEPRVAVTMATLASKRMEYLWYWPCCSKNSIEILHLSVLFAHSFTILWCYRVTYPVKISKHNQLMNKTDRFHYFLLLPLHTEPEDGAKEQERSGGLKCLWEILFCSAYAQFGLTTVRKTWAMLFGKL